MTGAEAADRARRSRASFLAAVERARPDGKVVGDWTVREVLAHSTGWVQLLLWMLDSEHADARSDHSGVDDFNRRVAEAAAGVPLREVRAEFERVSDGAIALIERLSQTELDRPGRFEWDRTLTLARAIEENTFAHFDEHAAQLRAAASL
ncbi:MAG: ClbS/DfsB family four-helix bundle protein [Chloroflexi bacterium]|nr:ClbS/DfsB family four-helix bundle protein [Chloroflexota bacterium]